MTETTIQAPDDGICTTIAPEKRAERVAYVLRHTPESAKGCLKRAFSGSGGRANAIKAMCLTCVGYDRQEIKNCTGYGCPLWAYRPFQD